MHENIILDIGSERFARTLFSEVQQPLALRQLVSYRYTSDRKVELLLAESADDDANMNRVIRDYSQNLYSRDPLFEHVRPLPIRQRSIHHIEADSIEDSTFRDTLYRTQQMGSKTAIVIRRPADAIVIGFFRGNDTGELSSRQWDFLDRSAGSIAAAVERHFELAGSRRKTDWQGQLASMGIRSPLSKQEVAVCAQILEGYFNEAIALNMGISIHSVITYRRRAFAKLGVSTQSQLFNLVIRNTSN